MDLGWLLLVPGLGPFSMMFGSWGLTEASCCLFERIKEVVKHESRPNIIEKLL